MATKGTRRTSREVEEISKQAHELFKKGMGWDQAAKQLKISPSALLRWRKRNGLNGRDTPPERENGSVDARSLPPRPTGGRGGKRRKKEVDTNDVQSLALAVGKLDRKLQGYDDDKRLRDTYAKRLLQLLSTSLRK